MMHRHRDEKAQRDVATESDARGKNDLAIVNGDVRRAIVARRIGGIAGNESTRSPANHRSSEDRLR